jgi:hypothetical protein
MALTTRESSPQVVHRSVQRRSLHFGAVAGQSTSSLHSTQRRSEQTGVGAAHSAFVVQPLSAAVRHSPSATSHTGLAAGQSELARHWTQRPRVIEQRGSEAGQSAFVAHATQRFVVSSQIGAPAPQSAFVRHPRHAPVAASQSLAESGHDAGLVAEHAGRHSCSPG